jgi:hypothetical protein
MQAGEYRTVGSELFAAALQQGAYPAPEEFTPSAVPQAPPAPEPLADAPTISKEFAIPGIENAMLLGDESEEEDRYPEGATVAPDTTPLEERVTAAMVRIITRNDAKDFNSDGVPKARALTAEMGGVAVVAELRERLWEQLIKKEVAL